MTARKKKRKRAAMVEGLTKEGMYEMMDGDRRALGMHVNMMEKLHEARQQVHWLEGEIRRLQSLASLPDDPRQREAVRQLAILSRQAYEHQNTIQHLEWLYMSAVSKARRMMDEHGDQMKRAKREKKKAEDAKNSALKREREAAEGKKKAEDAKKKADRTVDKMSDTLQKQNEEMKAAKKRNSRLAAEANRIKTGRRKRYKPPAAGKRGGNRETHRCMPVTKHRAADQHACHVCRTRLGNATETRPRILEDMELGRWEVIRYDVTRRWCPGCKRLQSTIPGAGPKQRFGNRALAMLSFRKMIGVSFRKIEKVFMAFYMVHISKKAIQEAVRTVSGGIMHQYEAIHRHILEESASGDETAWRVTGLLYWVWRVLGDDAVWFNIQEGRGIPEAKEMLPEYGGMVMSDSHAPWNHVGKGHQKCHLHYKRELKKTIQENKNPEFQAFAAKLSRILWDSHDPKKGYGPDDDPQTRKRKQRNLMRRLACLMEKDYTDRDCKRFLKRLRREFYRLFSHVMYGIDWHNNKAERAVRCFVLLRHVMFGNRTEFDAATYAVLLSIIGTCAMRGVNPLEYIVESLSKPCGSPVELPRPPTDPK